MSTMVDFSVLAWYNREVSRGALVVLRFPTLLKEGAFPLSEQFQVRPVQAEDYVPLADLYAHYALNTVYTYYNHRPTPEYMRQLFATKGHLSAVGVLGSQVIGYVHLSPAFSLLKPYCTIAIYVLPAYTGKGYGPILITHGEEMAKKEGIPKIRATICTENQRSIDTFTALGYQYAGKRVADASKFGRILHSVYYDKFLSPPGDKH